MTTYTCISQSIASWSTHLYDFSVGASKKSVESAIKAHYMGEHPSITLRVAKVLATTVTPRSKATLTKWAIEEEWTPEQEIERFYNAPQCVHPFGSGQVVFEWCFLTISFDQFKAAVIADASFTSTPDFRFDDWTESVGVVCYSAQNYTDGTRYNYDARNKTENRWSYLTDADWGFGRTLQAAKDDYNQTSVAKLALAQGAN